MCKQFSLPANEGRLQEPLGRYGLVPRCHCQCKAQPTPASPSPRCARDASWGCQETPHSASPLPSCIHSQPVSVTGPGPWHWSTEKSAEGQLSGEAKWACCPSVAGNVGRKIKCNHVQIITPMCMSLSISHLFFIICLSISGGPVDPRHTVGAQKEAKRGPPSSGS